jgi:putative endonuclease
MASKARGTLYIGVTSDLSTRIWQHKTGLADGFTKRYGIKLLVWYEMHETMTNAIHREKCLKQWRRLWKIELVETSNPTWIDRYAEIG